MHAWISSARMPHSSAQAIHSDNAVSGATVIFLLSVILLTTVSIFRNITSAPPVAFSSAENGNALRLCGLRWVSASAIACGGSMDVSLLRESVITSSIDAPRVYIMYRKASR